MADAEVLIEEHPELDNPLDAAKGAVEGWSTQLAEYQDALARSVTDGQKAVCQTHIDEVTPLLDAAKARLAEIEGN